MICVSSKSIGLFFCWHCAIEWLVAGPERPESDEGGVWRKEFGGTTYCSLLSLARLIPRFSSLHRLWWSPNSPHLPRLVSLLLANWVSTSQNAQSLIEQPSGNMFYPPTSLEQKWVLHVSTNFRINIIMKAMIFDHTCQAQESLPPRLRPVTYNVMVESQPPSPKANKKAGHMWCFGLIAYSKRCEGYGSQEKFGMVRNFERWECDGQCIRIAMPVLFWKSSVAGIPLSYEFSEVIEAVELWLENLKKTHEIQPTKPTMNVRKND